MSIVVPTRNEVENVAIVSDRLARALDGAGWTWELLFVDDSDDDTPRAVQDLRVSRPNVSLMHRPPGERNGGLSGAVAAGFQASNAAVVVVMDGDLQHPPEVVRELVAPVQAGVCDIAIGSRYVPGASAGGLDGRQRRFVSRASSATVHALVPRSRRVRDPMSGFFAVSRETIEGVRLRAHGFKILLELLARSDRPRVMEIPFRMERRATGRSKAGWHEGARFLRHVARLSRPGRAQAGRTMKWLAGHAPLAAILAGQAWLSARLLSRNTAFLDEATYISAGKYALRSWVHKTPDMRFPTYFSGAPTIYPVLAGLADSAGGLRGARLLSLVFMLVTTTLGYAVASRLFGRPAGWLAAAVFVTSQGTQFLGAFATFDSMALMLTAAAAWIVVRGADSTATSSQIYLAVPVLALANATKYASAAFDPIVLGVAFFLVLGHRGPRAAAKTTATLVAGLVMVLALLLAASPPGYLTGVLSTTVKRAPSSASMHRVLHLSWIWVGGLACLALLAVAVSGMAAWRRRSGWPQVGLLAVLAAGVLVAPANQARIHTATSLSKHVTFGAWFGAVAAGWIVQNVSLVRPVDLARGAAATLTLVPMVLAGAAQADRHFEEWPNSTGVIAAMRPLLVHTARPVLMDDAPVGRYYLQKEVDVPLWVDTHYFAYTPPGATRRLVGIPAYVSAIDHGAFSVVALDYGQQKAVDAAVAQAIHQSGRYKWVGDFATVDEYGHGTYVVWKLRAAGP